MSAFPASPISRTEATVAGQRHNGGVRDIEDLLGELIEAERAYRDGSPVMEDKVFDGLRDELAAHPSAAEHEGAQTFLNSVAGGVIEAGDVEHLTPMLSLDKITDEEGLQKFLATLSEEQTVLVTPKLDGIALSIVFEEGKLARMVTRGDGRTGTDVTHNRRIVANVPDSIDAPGRVEVRGEVVMTHEDMAAAAEGRGEAFKNRRNPIGPALARPSHSTKTYDVPTRFIAYSADLESEAGDQALGWLASKGFVTIVDDAFGSAVLPADPTVVMATIEAIGEVTRDPAYDYFCDGVVVSATDPAERDRLGLGSRTPKWAKAYKFASEVGIGILERIELDVGKTGGISFTGVLAEPVSIAGTMVQRASLHNPDQIARQGLFIGARVTVSKMNDIIPQIVALTEEQDITDPELYVAPTTCPKCEQDLNFDKVRPKCMNPECALLTRMTNAVGRNAFDLDGASGVLMEKAIDAGLVSNIADVFALTADEWRTLDGVEGSADKIVAETQRALKGTRLDNVLAGLQIRWVNQTFARRLADHFRTLEAVRDATLEQLFEVEAIKEKRGTEMKEDLVKVTPVINRLLDLGLEPLPMPERVDVESSDHPLAGKKVLVTGTIDGMSRTEVKEALIAVGAKPAGSPSKSVDIAYAGEGAGPAKLDKITALAIELHTGEEFLAALAATTGAPGDDAENDAEQGALFGEADG